LQLIKHKESPVHHASSGIHDPHHYIYFVQSEPVCNPYCLCKPTSHFQLSVWTDETFTLKVCRFMSLKMCVP